MKVIAVCPNCKEEIGIDGIRIVIDGSKTDVKSKLKGYIGWTDNSKAAVNPSPPPLPPDVPEKEFSDSLDKVINKSPPPSASMDKELYKYLKEEKSRDIPPPQQTTNNNQPITKIDKPIKLPEDKPSETDILKQPSVDLSTSTIDAIGREISKRISEFKSKGICLICNTKPGSKDNLICDDCLQNIIVNKVEQERKEEEKVRTVW